MAIFGSDEDEDEYSLEEEDIDDELIEEFKKKTVEFTFVRGGDATIEYHDFNGRLGSPGGLIKRIEDGIYESERAGAEVEKLCKVAGVRAEKAGGVNTLLLLGESRDEVTPANVAHRHVKSTTDMEVRVPVKVKVKRREDTGEVTSRGIPRQDGEMELREV